MRLILLYSQTCSLATCRLTLIQVSPSNLCVSNPKHFLHSPLACCCSSIFCRSNSSSSAFEASWPSTSKGGTLTPKIHHLYQAFSTIQSCTFSCKAPWRSNTWQIPHGDFWHLWSQEISSENVQTKWCECAFLNGNPSQRSWNDEFEGWKHGWMKSCYSYNISTINASQYFTFTTFVSKKRGKWQKTQNQGFPSL